jgi:hypothetical protein
VLPGDSFPSCRRPHLTALGHQTALSRHLPDIPAIERAAVYYDMIRIYSRLLLRPELEMLARTGMELAEVAAKVGADPDRVETMRKVFAEAIDEVEASKTRDRFDEIKWEPNPFVEGVHRQQ